MTTLKLIRPELKHKNDVLAYKNEFLEAGDSLHGTAGLRNAKNYEAWQKQVMDNRHEETVQEGLVPASTYLAIREEDQKLVGMIDIRHRLNDFLINYGGHIGYSVRKSERRKGYATKMLSLALEKCRSLNIEKVLVTCNKSNVPSAKTILHNGGVLENELIEPVEDGDDEIVQRYWIAL